MRIISKFKDYYDSIQAYGYDDRPVYVRDQRTIELNWSEHKEIKEREMISKLKNLESVFQDMPTGGSYSLYADKGVISFCGRCYPFYKFEGKCYYDLEKMIDAVRVVPRAEMPTDFDRAAEIRALETGKFHRHRWRHWRHYGSLSRDSWEVYNDETNFVIPDDVHMHFKSPVLLRRDKELIINPRLNQWSFQTQVDPYTAHQEIAMYVGNNLATQMDPEVNISDELRAESKGFDKWSFRTHKDDSKKNRK